MHHSLRGEYSMASAHAGPGDWNSNGHHMYRDYRKTAPSNNAEWYYPQRGARWDNRGAPTPAYYDTYEASHPVDYYEASPQVCQHPYSQGLPRAAQNIAQWHNVSGPYGQRPPSVTVHHTEQVLQAHSGLGSQAHHSELSNQAHPPSHRYTSKPWQRKFHQYEHNPPDGRAPMYLRVTSEQIKQCVGHRPRRQSWRDFKGGQSRDGHSTSGRSNTHARKTVSQNTPSSQCMAGSSQEVNRMNTAPSDAMFSQLAPPVIEHGSDSSVAQQCFSLGPDLKENTGPDVRNPTASQSTHADDSSQVPPSTMSACTASQQGTSTLSSQSLAPNQWTPGDCVSSSGMTQPECSPPVTAVIYPTPAEQQIPPSDLFMTPKDKTPPEKTLNPMNEINKWIGKRIDKMIATNNQVVMGNQNAGIPNGAFAVEKINVSQPGRREGQPRDKPSRTSDGYREEDSTLRLEIQSASRCVLVKTVPIAPLPVAVVPPLEPEVPSQPVETEGSVHGSTEGGLLSTINENEKVSESCTKNIVMADDNAPENNVCGRSILERLLAADNSQDLTAVDHPLVNKLSVQTESQSSSAQVISAEGSYVNHRDSISEDLNEAKESVLDVSSIAVIDYTLSDLRKLVARLESSCVPQVKKDNIKHAILDYFWGGDIQNLHFNVKEFWKEMVDFRANALKADGNGVILTAVDSVSLEELFDKCPSGTHSSRSSSEKFRSSWLNVNEKVDDIDQEPGVAWPLCFTLETAEAETRSKEHVINTETSDVEKNEAVEMERGRKTEIETEVQTDMKMEAQTETGVQRSKETHTVVEGPSHNESERVDITTESTIATEAPGSDEEPSLDTPCNITMTLLSPEDAKKVFDQLQNDPTLSVPLSENKGQTKTRLAEEGVVGQEEQNTPDLLSVEEEPARLEMNGLELSYCCSSLVETPDKFRLGLCTTGLTERKGQKGDVSEIQDGRRKGLHNILKPEYFSLSVEILNYDQEETKEVSIEPKSHTKAQDLPGDWMEPLSPGDLAIDSGDEFGVMHLISDMTVSFDQEEMEAVNEKTNEQTEPMDLHGEPAQPIVPGLAIGVTSETDVFSVLKPLSEERRQGDPCSPLEVFESVDAFFNAQNISFNIYSIPVMSLSKMTLSKHQEATAGNARTEMESESDSKSEIENNQHRLKIPKIAQRLGSTEFDLESESQAKDSQCMDSETQIPHKGRPSTSLTDNSSVETDDNSDRPKTGQRRRHSTKSNMEDNSTKKHVALKRRRPISTDTIDTESDAETFERKHKRLTTAPPARYLSESGSSILCNDKVSPLPPLTFPDVTEDSSDDCTLSESHWERPKTSPTERLTSETEDKSSKSTTSVQENSTDDSTVSQHHPVVKRWECSSVSSPPFVGVQSLIVQQSLTNTAPLQLRRKTLDQILQKQAKAESTKPRPQNKERPSIVELSQVKRLSPSKSHFEKTERKEKQKRDEQKLSSPESSPKSLLRKNDSKREEKRGKEKSYRPSSPMQNREKKTGERRAEHEDKIRPNKDQEPKKILNPERNSPSSKPELPKIQKFDRDEMGRFVAPTVHTPRRSPCHNSHEEKEKKGEKRDAQKSSCSESLRTKEKTDVKRGDQHSSGPKVSGSIRQTGPSIAMAAPSPTNGPVKTTGSAREQVHSNWKSRFIPTPVRRGRRSGSIEDHTSPLMKSMVQSGSRKDHAAPLMKKSMVQSGSRKGHAAPLMKNMVQSVSREDHAGPLMKKSIVEAERWTKANHRKIQRDYRHSSSPGTHKTNEQPRTFEERYKWAEEQNIRQNRKSYTRDWNRSRKIEEQNPLDQLFRK